MNSIHGKVIYFALALLAILASLTLLGILGRMQQAFLVKNVFAGANPLALLAIFAVLVFGGIYFLRTGGQMIRMLFK